jgi:ribosomal protein S18 acetylase RimI-like enzyme
MGVGEALNVAAIEEARRRGAKHVSLTSRAARETANRLYQRLGFDRYETNVYRLTL